MPPVRFSTLAKVPPRMVLMVPPLAALTLKVRPPLSPVKSDPRFEEVRQTERACKNALRRNDEEYESLVSKWGAELTKK